MSVLVFIETENSLLKKNFSQIASYGVALSKKLGVKCIAIAFNTDDCEKLSEYGITEFTVFNSGHKFFDCLNNANIICLGSRLISSKNALNLVNIFLKTKFQGGRHLKRVKKI